MIDCRASYRCLCAVIAMIDSRRKKELNVYTVYNCRILSEDM